MPRHRILLQTNPTFLRTGLAENAKTLLKYLWKTGRYDVAHLCTQGMSTADPRLSLSPWKSFGSIPMDQNLINHINSDPHLQRNASYGAFNIDNVIKEWKPTIWIGSDDAWSFQVGDYADKPWYRQINSIHHITVDSYPVLDLAFEQAKRSKVYLTWAKFAAREMKRVKTDGSMSHVSSIYGAMDTTLFSPISPEDKANVRQQFGITPDTFIFLFVGRNQLRKSMLRCIDALARFKRENPGVNAKLHFHTSFSERAAGWDIPARAAYAGLNPDDILCTYVCKHCGRWWVAPYSGEDIKCPFCGAEKSAITASITNGVPAHEMRLVYGISDACLSAFTSGGQEYHSVQSLLCAKPTAITNYTCGEDFCVPETADFVYPLKWHATDEMQTSFIKASTDPSDICAFMRKVTRASKRDLQEIGEKSRAWATREFSIETIGPQWEKLFESMPVTDWSSVTLIPAKLKNEGFPMPTGSMSDDEFIQTLYREVLFLDEKPDGEGAKHWRATLGAGKSREEVYRYFIDVARQDNAKVKPAQDFGDLLDKTGRKRGLFVIKESLGDAAICTALFKSFHKQHPDTDLYVATDPKYAEVFLGNELVHKVLPYIQQMENELMMIGQGTGSRYFDVFYHPAIPTQRILQYLSHPEPAFTLTNP